MKIVLMGGKNLAVNCLAYLLERGEEISAVVVNPSDAGAADTWYPSLKTFAQKRRLPVYQPANASNSDFVAFMRALAPDLMFSMSYEKILRQPLLDVPPLGAINVHFGHLPCYRGCLPLVYALANGEAKVGVTLHYMDAGIDTGDIIAQIALPVEARDTAYSLYFKCVAAGTMLFQKEFGGLKKGFNQRTPQNDAEASNHRQVYPHDRWIDWHWPPARISAFIRAHTFRPYPGARFRHGGQEKEVRMTDGRCRVDGRSLTFDEFLAAYGPNAPQ
jgi:methionyl-tRNA formyltransferase